MLVSFLPLFAGESSCANCTSSQELMTIGILVKWSTTNSPSEKILIKDGGRRKTSSCSCGPPLEWSLK
jgi:hypothetical protein